MPFEPTMKNWRADPRPGCGISYVSQMSAIAPLSNWYSAKMLCCGGGSGVKERADAKASVGRPPASQRVMSQAWAAQSA